MSTWAATTNVLMEVLKERERQDGLWGEQNHNDGVWSLILTEEVGEASQQALRLRFGPDATVEEAAAGLRQELIQVAAVAVSWVEALDRRPL